jgi:lipid-A-disaccharide synthase-like uncharacterized protein
MDNPLMYVIGFGAQLMFSLRIIVQWISSERAGQVTTPLSFWFLSLGGAILMVVYGLMRHDIIITAGQMVLFCIYCRNLTLAGYWTNTPFVIQLLPLIPLGLLFWPSAFSNLVHANFTPGEGIPGWLLWLGAGAQLAMFSRFILQWLRSEQLRRSILPSVFWWTSTLGAVLLLVYAIFRRDIVLMTGQVFGIVVYLRNLVLIMRQPKLAVPTVSS